MFKGIDYVGIGVSNMDRSLKFYCELLEFTEVLFDYTGPLPGMEKVTGKPETKARVVMLKNRNTGPIGLGMIKLVQLLSPDKPESIPADMVWGDVGFAEFCLRTHGVAEKFGEIVQKGCNPVLAPTSAHEGSWFAYMADPDGGLFEFASFGYVCTGMRTEPTVEGVNHVGFGVSNTENSLKFYRELGFTELIRDYSGYLVNIATMLPEPLKIRFVFMANYYGAWIQPIQLLPPYKAKAFKRAWGHLGPMEFAVGVSNIEKAYEELQKKGIKFLSPLQTVEVSSGQWKYAYVVEPDNLYISLVEPRY